MRCLDDITNLMDMSLSKLQELMMDREGLVSYSPWGRRELDMTEGLSPPGVFPPAQTVTWSYVFHSEYCSLGWTVRSYF